MKRSLLTIKLVAVVTMCAVLSACTSIPDIKPFADATADLATALNRGYGQTEAQLAMLQAENPDLEDNAKDKLKELRKRWKPTKEAINALVAYTDSLSALAEAGKTGKEAANKLTSSFEGLYGAIGQLVPLPGISEGVKVAFRAMAAANGAIAKMRARKSLKDAAEDAAPAVRVLARILAENFTSLEQISRAAGNAAAEAVRNNHQGLLDYQKSLVDNKTRIESILSRLNRYFGLPAATRAQAERVRVANANGRGGADAARILNNLPDAQLGVLIQIKILDPGSSHLTPNDPNLVKKLESRQKELLAQSASYRAEQSRIDVEYQSINGKIVTIDSVTRNGAELFSKSQEAIKAWAKAHDDLKLALEKKQGLTFRELVSIVKEITDSLDKGANT